MLSDKGFTKKKLDLYLKELAKEYRKRNGKTMPVEIILIQAVPKLWGVSIFVLEITVPF